MEYLSYESCCVCEHMIVNVCVLHRHSPVLVVSIDDQGKSYNEGSWEKNMLLCELSD